MFHPFSYKVPALKRSLLLGVAGSALLAVLGHGAFAGCTQNGKAVTCTGNGASIIDGINGNDYADPLTSLDVHDITVSITPPGGKDGVFVHTDSESHLNVNLNMPFNGLTGPYLETRGASADGIDAAVTNSGTLDITSNAWIITNGANAYGIRAYSSLAGNITILEKGRIRTKANGAHGIYAYAYANGSDIDITTQNPPDLIRTEGAGAHGIFARSDTAGDITIQNNTGISTTADDSHAIYARSESGGDITITNSQDIQTQGKNSSVIRAYSDQGDIHITNNKQIYANGVAAHGIFTSSPQGATVTITNKGTIFAGDDADAIRLEGDDFNATITIDSGGEIYPGQSPNGMVSGVSVAIHIIDNGTTPGTHTITNKGTIHANGYGEAAIRSDSGANILNNSGTIDGPIYFGWGDDTINNSGFIWDDVNLGAGQNAFNNLSGGTFAPMNSVIVGDGNTFTNEGVLTPNVNGTKHVTIIGDFEQKAAGKTIIDINTSSLATPVDKLTITGTARLAGKIVPRVATLNDDTARFLIIEANSVVNNGLQVEDTAEYDFGLDFTGTQVYLTAKRIQQSILEMLAGAGTADERAFARHLDAVHEAGGNGTTNALFDALAKESDATSLASALNRLIPNGILVRLQDTLHADASFGNALLSCRVRAGTFVFTREGQCSWVRLSYRRSDRKKSARDPGMDENAAGLAAGMQVSAGGNWRLGLALGYERTDADFSDNVQKLGKTKGDRLLIGAVTKNQIGPLNFYASLAGSFTRYANRRYVNVGGVATTARSHQNITSATARLRFSWLQQQTGYYFRPMIDLAATHLHLSGYSEQGAGAANLDVHGKNKWLLSTTPALEVGGQIDAGNEWLVRPWLRAGVNLYSRGSLTTTASLQGAPSGVAPFATSHRFGKLFADIQTGLYVLTAERLQLKIAYEGRFSNKVAQHLASLKFGLRF